MYQTNDIMLPSPVKEETGELLMSGGIGVSDIMHDSAIEDSSSRFSSNVYSPETEEFALLERQTFREELEQKIQERKLSENNFSSDVLLSGNCEDSNKFPDVGDSDPISLQLVEKRQLRSFSRADEYLYAMKEDLAEWLNMLYPGIDIDAENFMDLLQTGEHLLRHANCVRKIHEEIMWQIQRGEYKRKPPSFAVPESDLPIRENVVPGTWFARDNVYNFIKFCRLLKVMEVVMFETEDLVSQKNEKHVILTLLEVARRGAKIGMLAPMLVQFEQEIDQELAREEKEQKKKDKLEKEKEKLVREEEKNRKRKEKEEREREERVKEEETARQNNGTENDLTLNNVPDITSTMSKSQDDMDMFPSLAVEVEKNRVIQDMEEEFSDDDNFEHEDYIEEEEDEYEDEEDEEEEEGYPYPIGPMPQFIGNDLRSLDEMVRDLVEECQCPSQFAMIRVSEGKYRIGDTQALIFVRILRNHVMVRVGGGWDTLQNYLDKHDPCRCRRGHRSTMGAHLNMKCGISNNTMAHGVTYNRSESPGTPRRRSSGFQGLGSRQGSFVRQDRNGGRNASNPSRVNTGKLQPWDMPWESMAGKHLTGYQESPRGSVGNILDVGGIKPRSRSPSAPHNFFHQGPYSPGSTRYNAVDHGGRIKKISNGPSPLLQDRRTNMSPKVSKDGFIPFPARSDSSCSLTSVCESLHKVSGDRGEYHGKTQLQSSEALVVCDSSSEVSDEGYRSSQGNLVIRSVEEVGPKEKTNDTSDSLRDIPKDVDLEERSESRMTVGSDCSSTISTEDERSNTEQREDESSSTSPTICNDSIGDNKLEKSKISNQQNEDHSLSQYYNTSDETEVEQKKSSTQLSPSTKNRLSNLFQRIPKFGKSRTIHGGDDDGIEGIEEGYLDTPKSTTRSPNPVRTLPPTPLNSRRSKPSHQQSLLSTPPEQGKRSSQSEKLTRTRSSSSDKDFTTATPDGHGSYRAPKGYSRYMQAAEAYVNKSKSNNNKTWSSSVSRARSRPGLSSDQFTPVKPSRTASASPGLHRKPKRDVSTDCHHQLPTSTHSTPSRRPLYKRTVSREEASQADVDEMIMKRMEEILYTYKAKVEDRLAAEGKELPKDIFEDFTTHWVNSSSLKAKSMDSLDSTGPLDEQRKTSGQLVFTPSHRKDYRDGQKGSKIPLPTFYKSPVPSETHL